MRKIQKKTFFDQQMLDLAPPAVLDKADHQAHSSKRSQTFEHTDWCFAFHRAHLRVPRHFADYLRTHKSSISHLNDLNACSKVWPMSENLSSRSSLDSMLIGVFFKHPYEHQCATEPSESRVYAHRGNVKWSLWEFSFIKEPWSAYTPADHSITPCASSAQGLSHGGLCFYRTHLSAACSELYP